MFAADSLRRALAMLGELLEQRGLAYEIVAVGGGGLLMLGVIHRPTKDLDALARVEGGQYVLARPLPPPLVTAIAETASALGLEPDWLNPGPTDQLKQGLPDGFRDRTTAEVFDGLTIHLAGRYDQICLKIYAAADAAPNSKHVDDLIALAPNDAELVGAAAWVKQQDAGVEFAGFVDAVVLHLKARRGQS
jgi:hypothetical protein